MVGLKGMSWLPEATRRRVSADVKNGESSKLGILAFEAAKTMSRLICLYKSVSDGEISRLKNDVVKSAGVAFLNSGDEEFLLSLAYAEKVEDLDRAAAAVSRLGKKCDDFGLNRFDLVYRDLKQGIIDHRKPEYGSKVAEKKVKEMKKLATETAGLQAALESLTGLEISEKKMKQFKNKEINLDEFTQKLENQRKEVKYFREISLWSKSFYKVVDLMARIVCILYSRICSVFGSYRKLPLEKIVPHSGPLLTKSKPIIVRFYSRRMDENDGDYGFGFRQEQSVTKSRPVFQLAGAGTVGGSGLAMRYADLILSAEKYLSDPKLSINDVGRESLYQMLPENLKAMVRTKLSKKIRCLENDESLAVAWRTAMAEMMRWLAPVARDTVAWQMERSFERMKFNDGDDDEDEDESCSVLLLQTLYFSDLEKTEAAIAEVLVGLSCIFKFENRVE